MPSLYIKYVKGYLRPSEVSMLERNLNSVINISRTLKWKTILRTFAVEASRLYCKEKDIFQIFSSSEVNKILNKLYNIAAHSY